MLKIPCCRCSPTHVSTNNTLKRIQGKALKIFNNRITIDQAGYFQGTARMLFTNSVKTDITILTMPILYACNTYLKSNKEQYLFLFEKAIEAFNILKISYEGNEIIHTIDSLIGFIREYMDTNTNVVNAIYNTDSGRLKQAFYNSISKVWTEERLTILFGIINQLRLNGTQINSLVTVLEAYMNFIDEKVHDIITGLS
jgi:hypothetical protein